LPLASSRPRKRWLNATLGFRRPRDGTVLHAQAETGYDGLGCTRPIAANVTSETYRIVAMACAQVRGAFPRRIYVWISNAADALRNIVARAHHRIQAYIFQQTRYDSGPYRYRSQGRYNARPDIGPVQSRYPGPYTPHLGIVPCQSRCPGRYTEPNKFERDLRIHQHAIGPGGPICRLTALFQKQFPQLKPWHCSSAEDEKHLKRGYAPIVPKDGRARYRARSIIGTAASVVQDLANWSSSQGREKTDCRLVRQPLFDALRSIAEHAWSNWPIVTLALVTNIGSSFVTSASKQAQHEPVDDLTLEQLRSRNTILQEELDQLRTDHELLRRDSALLQAVLSSTTWRATLPLRSTVRLTSTGLQAAGAFTLRILKAIVPAPVRERFRYLRHALVHSNVSRTNEAAWNALVDRRHAFAPIASLTQAPAPREWPDLDISFVTFNNHKWLRQLVESLVNQAYPLGKISIFFVDHGSVDGSLIELESLQTEFGGLFSHFEVLMRPNRGFGAGHNVGIRAGKSQFCLVSNVDVTFEKDSLTTVVAMACVDDEDIACWELRQKPYEHPKFYDPVTWETNWCSHACVLLRRRAFNEVIGYDEKIFMYGEDVELSYRFRERGMRLRYCPNAIVWHFSYDHPVQLKSLQFSESVFANFYLRLRYGTCAEIAWILPLAVQLLGAPPVYDGSRRDVRRTLLRLVSAAPSAVARRRKSSAAFPFRAYDYDLVREGAFVASEREPTDLPLVSVVTRTIAGRGDLLAQALLSVANQTYSNLEHIVVEDGGEAQREVVDRIAKINRVPLTYLSVPKIGRSAAGNSGLAAANGDYVFFLDDDDLLFADHVSTLMQALRDDPGSVAAYSLAWDVAIKEKSGGKYAERLPTLHPSMQQHFDPVLLKERNYIPIQAILFKRSLYLERGGFDPEIDLLEDWNLWNKYSVGNTFSFVPKITSIFRTLDDPTAAAARQKAFNEVYPAVLTRNATVIRGIEEGLR